MKLKQKINNIWCKCNTCEKAIIYMKSCKYITCPACGMFVNCLDILEPHPLILDFTNGVIPTCHRTYSLLLLCLDEYTCRHVRLATMAATGKHFHSSCITVIIVQFLHYCCEKCLVFMCPLYVVITCVILCGCAIKCNNVW